MNPPKYFLYARRSIDEDDRQILSVDSQLTELREFARKERLVVAQEFTESMGRRKVENRGFEPPSVGGSALKLASPTPTEGASPLVRSPRRWRTPFATPRSGVQLLTTKPHWWDFSGGSTFDKPQTSRRLNRRLVWWRAGDLNPRPRRCERRALPTELAPHLAVSHQRATHSE